MFKNNKKERQRLRDEKRSYRSRHKSYTVYYTNLQARKLERKAKELNKTVPAYIKAMVESYQNHPGYLKHSEEKLRQLVLALRQMGGNINRITRTVLTVKKVSKQDLERIHGSLYEMKLHIEKELTHPLDMKDVLSRFVQQNRDKAKDLISFIESLCHDTQE